MVSEMKRIIDYIKEDQTTRYGLKSAASLTVAGKGVALPVLYISVGPLSIESTSDSESGERVVLHCEPFAPEDGLWNGPDIIPNDLKDGSFEASLWHDLLWFYAGDIAESCGMRTAEVKQWANAIFYRSWLHYDKLYHETPSLFTRIKARVAFIAVSLAKRWYGRVKNIFFQILLAICLSATFSGCYDLHPDWTIPGEPEPLQTEKA